MLRFAISAISFCISIPIILLALVLPANINGIIPVPLHKSTTLAPFFIVGKFANNTASIPNLNACFFV